MQVAEICKDQPLEHIANPHDPSLKLCNFQSTCPVMSQLSPGCWAPTGRAVSAARLCPDGLIS